MSDVKDLYGAEITVDGDISNEQMKALTDKVVGKAVKKSPDVYHYHEYGKVDHTKCSAELSVSTKGVYTWSIKATGNNFKEVLEQVEMADRLLQTEYGSQV